MGQKAKTKVLDKAKTETKDSVIEQSQLAELLRAWNVYVDAYNSMYHFSIPHLPPILEQKHDSVQLQDITLQNSRGCGNSGRGRDMLIRHQQVCWDVCVKRLEILNDDQLVALCHQAFRGSEKPAAPNYTSIAHTSALQGFRASGSPAFQQWRMTANNQWNFLDTLCSVALRTSKIKTYRVIRRITGQEHEPPLFSELVEAIEADQLVMVRTLSQLHCTLQPKKTDKDNTSPLSLAFQIQYILNQSSIAKTSEILAFLQGFR